MLWTRDEYVEHMSFGDSPREMHTELFGPLVGLPEEWVAQGATAAQLDLSEFGLDYLHTYEVGGLGIRDPYPRQVLEDTDHHIIERDGLGRTTKRIKASASIPLAMDFPVKTADDWLAIKPKFADHPDRTSPAVIQAAIEHQEQGHLMLAWMHGGFAVLRDLMGDENACIAFYEDPELVQDILDTVSQTNQRVLTELTRHVHIDQLCVHEDMAGKHAPLIGPDLAAEFIVPYYRQTWELLRDRGTKLFSQDSDGNMNLLIDTFLDAGVNIIYPNEPAGDMDIVRIRQKYGRKVAFKGGIDKFALTRGREAIRAELEYKMQPLMLGGGTCFALDHRIPAGTPLADYIYYIETARELLGRTPCFATEKGWSRMAF